MKTARHLCSGLIAAAVLLGVSAQADTVKLKLTSGTARKRGTAFAQRLYLLESKPAGIKKVPADLAAPLYGVLNLGPKENTTAVYVIVDAPEGKESRLFVDANANGDLTDDPPATWKAGFYQRDSNRPIHAGSAVIQLKTGSALLPLHFDFLRHDTAPANRPDIKKILLYYSDYAYEGKVTLDGKTYTAMLADDFGTADFRGKSGEKNSGVTLLIDANDDGKFDPKTEAFDITQPFFVGGTTYTIKNMSASGDAFDIVKASGIAASASGSGK